MTERDVWLILAAAVLLWVSFACLRRVWIDTRRDKRSSRFRL